MAVILKIVKSDISTTISLISTKF